CGREVAYSNYDYW
nr:immunoglobulin heavy chain junction region [Macaca mulatta]MOW86816.1 immunoglobulin heavy chain junction region [Macaca mulatta]MOW87222.1 immunoglobulin heavy chain junction region [Macaca mulatta]MOW87371.1 immunoglobulin heavy chain junction region [Macaca mulatta]MOW87541.1 immunoglobulin heavy chain junction region [Macaca mulatta]